MKSIVTPRVSNIRKNHLEKRASNGNRSKFLSSRKLDYLQINECRVGVRHFDASLQSQEHLSRKVIHVLDSTLVRTTGRENWTKQKGGMRDRNETKATALIGRLPLIDELPCRQDDAAWFSVKNKIENDQYDHRYAKEPAKDIRHDELLRS
jgi:hypothetical protein